MPPDALGLPIDGGVAQSRKIHGSTALQLVRAARPHQWAKNLLIFVPLAAAHRWNDPGQAAQAGVAFGAFCLLASAAYLLNDIFDLAADRRHPVKRLRPLASGAISASACTVTAIVLGIAGLAVASSAGTRLAALSLAYLFGTLLYSLRLKHEPIVDTLFLAGLYTWRLVAGGYATGIVISPWLFAFSGFLFYSLALAKRAAELRRLGLCAEPGQSTFAYTASDYGQISRFGTTSGYLAVLVLALYVASPETRNIYAHPHRLWLALPPVVYWISRVWLLTDRGELSGDPVLFALLDRASYLALACILVVGYTAI